MNRAGVGMIQRKNCMGLRASADAEAELHIHLHAKDDRFLNAIEDALARIRAGTFGVCEACKQLGAPGPFEYDVTL